MRRDILETLGLPEAQIFIRDFDCPNLDLRVIETPTEQGSLMAGALALVYGERHAHAHKAIRHSHWHRHDDGHHDHAHPGAEARGWHSHEHEHPHRPDLHHRHAH